MTDDNVDPECGPNLALFVFWESEKNIVKKNIRSVT